jgi:hypothetical protein
MLAVGAVCLGLLLCIPLFVFWPDPYRPPQPVVAIEKIAPAKKKIASAKKPLFSGAGRHDRSALEIGSIPDKIALEITWYQTTVWIYRSLAAARAPSPPKPAENHPPLLTPVERSAAEQARERVAELEAKEAAQKSKAPRRRRYARTDHLAPSLTLPSPIYGYTGTSLCGAPTRDGTPCRRPVRGGGPCWQHGG